VRTTCHFLHQCLKKETRFIHAVRWRSFWATVEALLTGGNLWLTALGRARAGRNKVAKHSIKAVDRLIGNSLLFEERVRVYGALAKVLLTKCPRPVLLIDTCDVKPGRFILSASVAWNGRAFPLYACVAPVMKPKKRFLVQFLDQLELVLPPHCKPILATDAGFESPWFEAVDAKGWDFVGRIRNRIKFLVNKRRISLSELRGQATKRARSIKAVSFPKHKPHSRRIVLSVQPKSNHRKRLTTRGAPSQRHEDKHYSKGANEPLVLATTLTCNAKAVVNIYATRMQVEENYRDAKNTRWGWALRQSTTRHAKRFEILMLIFAVACFIQQAIGFVAEQLNLHRHYQANTVRNRRVLSLFYLGSQILRTNDLRIVNRAIREMLPLIQSQIRRVSDAVA
jgi:hypothetical protein